MQPRSIAVISLASFFVAGAIAAAAIDGPVGRDAEKGDPLRWYQPADTPQKQYQNAMKEAQAAHAEAIRECRGRADRKECEALARERYETEIEQARGLLVRHNLG